MSALPLAALVAGTALAPLTLPVSVQDGVFTERALTHLRPVAAASGLGHTLYSRHTPPRTPLEAALSSYLIAVGDDAPYVEYWSRQEWKHIEAHADVDEALAARGGPLRFPRHAHVLYLQVGTRVRGPTCVWQRREAAGAAPDARFGALAVVPAVAGRVLRFDGALQHAVPRPADVWLAPFVISERDEPPEEYVRSVVLFNTWPSQSEPPLDVRRTPASAAMEIERACSDEHVRCSEQQQWEEAPVTRVDSEERVRMKLWLLGEKNRRMQSSRTIQLDVPAQALEAFTESRTVSILN